MTTFKVGDRIQYVGNDVDEVYTKTSIGRTGTITSLSSTDVTVQWDDGSSHNLYTFICNLKLIERETNMTLPEVVEANTKVVRIAPDCRKVIKGKVYTVRTRSAGALSFLEVAGLYNRSNFRIANENDFKIAEALAILKAAGDVTFKPHKPAFKPREVVLSKAYTAVINDKNVKVGCQVIAFEAVDDIAKAVAEARKYSAEY